MFKKCSICNLEKEYIYFNKNKTSKDGLRSECRYCQNQKKSINKNIKGQKIKCSHCSVYKDFSLIKKSNKYQGGYSIICNECFKFKYKQKPKYEAKEKIRGVIYLLECNGIYKIGKTIQKIKNRLTVLQTGNPYQINLVKQYKTDYLNYDEKILHNTFIDKHYINEWFILQVEDIDYIEKYFKINT